MVYLPPLPEDANIKVEQKRKQEAEEAVEAVRLEHHHKRKWEKK